MRFSLGSEPTAFPMHKPREETGNLCQHEETMGNCYGHVLIKVDISESKEPFALRGIRIEGA